MSYKKPYYIIPLTELFIILVGAHGGGGFYISGHTFIVVFLTLISTLNVYLGLFFGALYWKNIWLGKERSLKLMHWSLAFLFWGIFILPQMVLIK